MFMHSPDDPLPQAALIKIPRQPRSIEMVHNILDAGMQVIAETGLASMTTNRVAERAGVSIGSLYQYFANRESILAGIIERSQLDVTRRLRDMQLTHIGIPLDQLLKAGLIWLLQYYNPYIKVVRRVLQETALLADNSVIKQMESILMDLLRDYLLTHSDRYRVRNGAAALFVAVNSLIFLYLKWLSQPDARITEAAFIDALVQQVMAAVEVRP